MAGASNRPISPHLQIWKWGPGMAVSILHRVTGSGLSLVGLAVLLYWLGALASGPEAYAQILKCMTHPLGTVVLMNASWVPSGLQMWPSAPPESSVIWADFWVARSSTQICPWAS